MAKNRLAYRAYTAADLKARASVPDAADITTNLASIDCNNITTMKIRNAVTSGVNTVGGNAVSGNVNVWSAFGPTKRTLTAGLPLGRNLLTNSAPTNNFAMGDFAGYNHSAEEPAFTVNGVDEAVYIIPGANHIFYCIANIGEMLYTDITYGAAVTHVAFSVWNGTTYVDSKVKAISGMTNLADFSTNAADRITVTNIIFSAVYTCKIEMLSAPAYDYTGANTVCQVPGLDDWDVDITVMEANHVELSAPPGSGWAFEGTPENLNNTGHLVFEALMHRVAGVPTDVAHVQVLAYVLDYTGTKVTCDTELYHGGPTDVIELINVHVWRDPTDTFDLDNALLVVGYGYTCVVYVNEHPA
jgi:hypothetical protein